MGQTSEETRMCCHDPANTANSWGLSLHEQVWSNPMKVYCGCVCMGGGTPGAAWWKICAMMNIDDFIATEHFERQHYVPQFFVTKKVVIVHVSHFM